jgi:hypothetical protein
MEMPTEKITESDFKTPYAKRVSAPIAVIHTGVLYNSYLGIQYQIKKERFPVRKQRLKAIAKELKFIAGL